VNNESKQYKTKIITYIYAKNSMYKKTCGEKRKSFIVSKKLFFNYTFKRTNTLIQTEVRPQRIPESVASYFKAVFNYTQCESAMTEDVSLIAY
jgi:hypothetical protein